MLIRYVFAGLSSSVFTGLSSGGLHSQLSPLAIASAILLFQQLVASGMFASFMHRVISWFLDALTGLSGIVFTGLFITLCFR